MQHAAMSSMQCQTVKECDRAVLTNKPLAWHSQWQVLVAGQQQKGDFLTTHSNPSNGKALWIKFISQGDAHYTHLSRAYAKLLNQQNRSRLHRSPRITGQEVPSGKLMTGILACRHDAAAADRAATNPAAVPGRAAAGAAQRDRQPGPDRLAAATWRGCRR